MAVRRLMLCWVAVLSLAACQDGKLWKIGDDAPPGTEGEGPTDGDPENPGETSPVTGTTTCVGCPAYQPVNLSRVVRTNPIPAENQKPGDSTWRTGRQVYANQVELYASTDSAAAGDTIKVRVSTSVSSTVTASVYRIGWYNGAGARKVWTGGPYTTAKQAACAAQPGTMRVECDWTDTFSFEVDPSWVSGLYVIRVNRDDNFFRFTPFVVRDDRAAELLFGAATNTYQAYNYWGGESLYGDSSATMPGGRAWEVSYDRPYDGDDGAGQQLRYEMHLARYLEREGYDVSYVTNLDFVRFEKLLDGIGAFVHGGHDEYWDNAQRIEVDRALATGKVSLVHFGGNGAYWRTRSSTNTEGQQLRTLVCYKGEAAQDPVAFTGRFRDPPLDNPESKLFGSLYDGWQLIPFPLVVKDSSHWLFQGTNLSTGELIPGLVGYEFDKVNTYFQTPSPQNMSFESPLLTAEGIPSMSHAVDRTLPSGTIVFSAGTIYWPVALATEFFDPRVARMTSNVLERALSHRRAARQLTTASGSPPPLPAPIAVWAQSVDPFVGVAGTAGSQDGAGASATFNGPTGLAVLANGDVVVAETGGNRIRLVENSVQRTVTTIAGTGQLGFKDGPGSTAQFRRPTGFAVRADGSILVADSDNHMIRVLTKSGTSWNVSTLAGVPRSSGSVDGPALSAKFNRPTALALDAAGNVLVADQAGCKIRRISADGSTVITIAGGGPGFLDANVGTVARLNNPSAITVGTSGEIYVMDSGNQKIRRISAIPPYAVTTLAGDEGPILVGYWQQNGSFGFKDGSGNDARFLAQMGMISTAANELILADAGNARIRKIIPGADKAATTVWTIAGSGKVGSSLGTGAQADIVTPAGLAMLPSTKILVSDPYNNVIRVITR